MDNARIQRIRDKLAQSGLDADEAKTFQEAFHKLMLCAWEDEGLRAAFIADPAMVLEENGVVLPEGADPHVVERFPASGILDLPSRFPEEESTGEEELTDEELARVVGGQSGECNLACQVQVCAQMMLLGYPKCDI